MLKREREREKLWIQFKMAIAQLCIYMELEGVHMLTRFRCCLTEIER